MDLRVTMLGKLADSLDREVKLEIGVTHCTLADLRRTLADAYPAAAPDLLSPRLRACVSSVIVAKEASVQQGDDIALLPPVSGG